MQKPVYFSSVQPWLASLFYILLVLVGQLSPVEVVVVYALETVVIGLFHIVRLASFPFLSNIKENSIGTTVGAVLFFTLHYGFFVFIQTTFFFVFLSFGSDVITSNLGWKNYITVLSIPKIQIALFFMMIMHGYRFYFNFLKPKIYNQCSVMVYMFQPYLRIVVQQFVAILPGLFLLIDKKGFAVAIILIVLRTLVDVLLFHLKENENVFKKAVTYLSQPKRNSKNQKPANPEDVAVFLKMFINE